MMVTGRSVNRLRARVEMFRERSPCGLDTHTASVFVFILRKVSRVQIPGPYQPPLPPLPSPVEVEVRVDPRLQAIEAERRRKQDAANLRDRLNRRREIKVTEFGEKTTTEIVGGFVEIVRRALSGEQGAGVGGLLRGVAEGNAREALLTTLGIFPEGLPLIAGELLGFLLNATPIGEGEESRIAAEDLARRIKAASKPFDMQPMWKADP